MTTMPSSAIPAPVQYVVSLLTLPLLRSKAFPVATVTRLRCCMIEKLSSMTSNAGNDFDVKVSVHATSRDGTISFYSFCVECGMEWCKAERYLGKTTANLSFALTPGAVIAHPSRMVLWQAEKPCVPSYGLGLLKIKEQRVSLPPPTPMLKPLMIIGEVISPITVKTARPPTSFVPLPPPSPIESETSSISSEDDSHTFSDVTSSMGGSSDTEDDVVQAKWQPRRKKEAFLSLPPLVTRSPQVQSFKYADGETLVLSGGIRLGMPSLASGHPDMHVDADEWNYVEVDALVAEPEPTPKPLVSFPKEAVTQRQQQQKPPQRKNNKPSAEKKGFNFPMKGTSGVSDKKGSWRTARKELAVKV